MGNRHDDTTINSEQEDLVGSSSSELDDGDEDDEITDAEGGIQFNLCKTANGASLSLADSTTDWNSSTQEYQSAQQHHQQQLQHFRRCRRSFILMIVFGLGLLTTSFSLFIILPLYQKQLEIGSKSFTAYGSILFVSPIVTLLLVVIACVFSWAFKWSIQIYKFPIPVKRLLLISLCCGVAGTLCTVSSYRRVPCHLQDPLKGAALVYALVFYFLFCKKVMGLQKIFSATTAVVGLFISVDYGLCDEFRCHGIEISEPNLNGNGNGANTEKITPSVGWQGRAFWTLLYVAGITLWTLHLSLLEGNLVVLSQPLNSLPPNNLLSTISRLVSNSDRLLEECPNERPPQPKQRPKPAHLAAWIHVITLLILLTLGTIDIIPGAGPVEPLSQHWLHTGNTFICHLGIEPLDPILHNNLKQQQRDTLDYLSNLTPGSIIYNQTVQKLRRDKRSLENRHIKYFHRRIPHHIFESEHIQNHSIVHLNKTMVELYYNRTAKYQNALKKYKNLTSSTQAPQISRLIINTPDGGTERPNCSQVASYAWLLIGIYLMFAMFLFHFLDISESAVFTIAIITSSLPLIGLFWSTFKLENANGLASIEWAPSISGELICSLLGTPIVFLGLLLLYRSHFSDLLRPTYRTSSTPSSSNPYTSLRDA